MGYTIHDEQSFELNRSRRELPRATAGAVRLVWAAGPRELATLVAVAALTAAGVAAAVLLGRSVLSGVLEADRIGGGWSGFIAPLVALAAVTAVLTIAGAFASRQQQLLSELAGRHTRARIHDVACTVELAAFDDPVFHDRVARAQGGAFRATNIVHGLTGLAQSAQRDPAKEVRAMGLARFVEAGSHAELMARGGTYAELFGLQASAYTG